MTSRIYPQKRIGSVNANKTGCFFWRNWNAGYLRSFSCWSPTLSCLECNSFYWEPAVLHLEDVIQCLPAFFFTISSSWKTQKMNRQERQRWHPPFSWFTALTTEPLGIICKKHLNDFLQPGRQPAVRSWNVFNIWKDNLHKREIIKVIKSNNPTESVQIILEQQ